MKRRELLQGIVPMALLGRAGIAGAAQPGRLRSAICAYSFRDALAKKQLSYADLVKIAVDSGVDGLDLTVYWFPNQSDEFLFPLRQLAYRNGVEIYSLSIRSETTKPEKKDRDAEVANIQGWVDTAVKLGAGHIRVFGGAVPKTATEDQAAGWCVEVLKRAADYAGKHGVVLGLENHGGITAKAERIIDIVKKVGSPAVGINLDTGNFDRDTWRQVEACIPYAVNVQVKMQIHGDDGKQQPGDWPRVARMLLAGGYRGYLALEYEAKEDPITAVPVMARKLDALVRHPAAT